MFAKNIILKFNINGHEIFEIEKATAIGIRKGDENDKLTEGLRAVSFGYDSILLIFSNSVAIR